MHVSTVNKVDRNLDSANEMAVLQYLALEFVVMDNAKSGILKSGNVLSVQ